MWIAIDAVIRENSIPPTIRELQSLLGYRTSSAAWYILRQLQKIGVVHIEKDSSRGITLLEPYYWIEGD